MKDRRVELKVKIKSLAEEARIIRLEERKAKERGDWQLFHRLQDHRRGVVRSEARHSQLAYRTFLGKCRYPEEEFRTRTPIDFKKLSQLVVSFGPVWNYDVESQADFEARRSATDQLYAGMIMVMQQLNVASVAEYHKSQPDRAERNRVRKQRYQERRSARLEELRLAHLAELERMELEEEAAGT